MAVLQYALLAGCCGGTSQCCSSIVGVWYLCIAIIVLIILISYNDLLKSRCFFFGLPWSKSTLYLVNAMDEDEFHLLQDSNNLRYSCEPFCSEFTAKTPPPPYSAIEYKDEVPVPCIRLSHETRPLSSN